MHGAHDQFRLAVRVGRQRLAGLEREREDEAARRLLEDALGEAIRRRGLAVITADWMRSSGYGVIVKG